MKWIIILLTMFPGIIGNAPSKMIYTVGKESSVIIAGTSNVNQFKFRAPSYESRDTLVMVRYPNNEKVFFGKGLLRLPVKSFKNGNPMLTKDFKKILKAKEYPEILMSFRSVTSLADGNEMEAADAEIDITLAGTTISRCVRLKTSRTGDVMNIVGSQPLKFSDFGLRPPKNVLGFIHVNNELDVSFNLQLHIVRY